MSSVSVLTLLVLSLFVGPGSPASASYVGGTPPQVGAVDSAPAADVRPGGVTGRPGGATADAATGGLPITGGDIVGLCILALGVSAAGLALSLVGRRPSTASS